MRALAIVVGIVVALCGAFALGHLALIEVGKEVIVLRTQGPEGDWLETRLWIVDDGGVAWLHGGPSQWMRNLEARPTVEIERGGEVRRYRAVSVSGPHRRIDALLRQKYGLADRWVRFLAPDGDDTRAVRLEPL